MYSQIFNNVSRIPNGKNVKDPSGNSYPGVGHSRPEGGGALNVFGADFKAEGYEWTKALCAKDSDCDGLSNGEELGDPLCTWSKGSTPQFVVNITHPGISDTESSCENYSDPKKSSKYTAFQKLNTWLQIHVICLYVSWGFLLPVGVLIPMSFKDAFNNDKTMWFKVHRIMQTSGTLLLVIGCAAAFANVRVHFNGTHQNLGLAVLILAVLQILNAVFRPSKKVDEDNPSSMSRYMWELLHKNLGRLVIVLAWINVFLGVRLLEDWYITSPALTTGLISVQATIIVLLTLVAFWRYMKARNIKKDSSAVLERPNTPPAV